MDSCYTDYATLAAYLNIYKLPSPVMNNINMLAERIFGKSVSARFYLELSIWVVIDFQYLQLY
jgi:hypothetical protein